MSQGEIILANTAATAQAAGLATLLGANFKIVLTTGGGSPLCTMNAQMIGAGGPGEQRFAFSQAAVQFAFGGVPAVALLYTSADVLVGSGTVGGYGTDALVQLANGDGSPWDGIAPFLAGDVISLGAGRLLVDANQVVDPLPLPPEIPGGGGAEPLPVFLTQPGDLPPLTTEDLILNLGFTLATDENGDPLPTTPVYTLVGSKPSGVDLLVNGSVTALGTGIAVAEGNVTTISIRGPDPVTGPVSFSLLAENESGVATALCNILVQIEAPPPAPVWTPSPATVALLDSGVLLFGNSLSVSGATTIRVVGMPNKGLFFIDDDNDTPLAVDDEFSPAALAFLSGDADGDTGAVTGTLNLLAIGPGGQSQLTISISIQEPASNITTRTFYIEDETLENLAFDLTEMKAGTTGSIYNGTSLPIYVEDQSA